MRELFTYQKRVLVWANERQKIALFLARRLGKSLVSLRWATENGCQHVLIVSPGQVVDTWLAEIAAENQHAVEARGASWHPTSRHRRFVVTTYETLRINQWLQRHNWDCVILDESRTIANPKARITKVCLSSFKQVPFKAILSGSPASEGPLEYFTQMQFLHGSFCGHSNFYNWRSDNFQLVGSYSWFPTQGTLANILTEVNKSAYVLSRKGAGLVDVHLNQSHRLNASADLAKVYKQTEAEYALNGEETKWRAVLATWLHRLAGGCHPAQESPHKINELQSLLDVDLFNEQVIVWCAYNSELDRLYELLKVRHDRKAIISGNVSVKERWRIIQEFRKYRIRVLLCQVKALKFGVDLSSASTNVFFSQPWDSDSYEQAKDRIQHPTKKEQLLSIHLTTKGTVDEDVMLGLTDKRVTSSVMLGLMAKGVKRRAGNGI